MIDVDYDPDEETRYECFNCGTVVRTTNQPICPDCHTEMRNRKISLE